jgi:hypothetical protein
MTLAEFVNEEQNRLERFKEFWQRGQDGDPMIFPNNQEAGEWDEMFADWEENDHG